MNATLSDLLVPQSPSEFRRLEARFLKCHRWTLALVMLAMLGQAVLLLPIPLLQGSVLDQLLRVSDTIDRDGIMWAAGLALAATVCCLGLRALLFWFSCV